MFTTLGQIVIPPSQVANIKLRMASLIGLAAGNTIKRKTYSKTLVLLGMFLMKDLKIQQGYLRH